MMDNNTIADFLIELARRRDAELIQNQEMNSWSEAEDCAWQNRTDSIREAANSFKNFDTANV